MRKKYYYVTVKNIFDDNMRKDIIAEKKDGELYDILLGNKIYAIDRKEIYNFFYFDKEKYIKENYDLIGIVFSEVSRIFVVNYLKDMKEDILRKMHEIGISIQNSLKDKKDLVVVKLYDPKK